MKIDNPENRIAIANLICDLRLKDYPINIYKRLINTLLWSVTTDSYNGKVDDIKYKKLYWTEKAIKKRNKNIKDKVDINKGLRHEHLIPKNLIRNSIESLKQPTPELILEVINNYEFAAIVTKEEDDKINKIGLRQKIPKGYTLENATEDLVLSRYIEAGIKLYEVQFIENEVRSINEKLIFKNKKHIIRPDKG
ncbi:MAG: hypothetical protein H6587_13155 [Flavobacteriales bacterium]|nr:hypothetical protein [Flavobacteriales bacterium]MCB9365514.1 hypothetical protein [Flavobacteriales bacterium]